MKEKEIKNGKLYKLIMGQLLLAGAKHM